MNFSRRQFLNMGGGATALAAIPSRLKALTSFGPMDCPFRLAVINDEISQDFEHACHIAAREFGLQWIELRGMWNKSIITLDSSEVAECRRILEKYKLRVTDIGSPLYKVYWPGAPLSRHAEGHATFHANADFKQQDKVLERSIELAKTFQTDRIRCFDFWRLDDQAPYRAAMNDKLRIAAEACKKKNLILLLENEMSCNTATGAEAAKVLAAIPNSNFMLNWDPGNAAAAGEIPFPNGYDLLPKHRIGHCHCKDVALKAGGMDGKFAWAPVGAGIIDWVGQFKALKAQGYHYAVSLETHWRGAGTPEASTRISMAGLKATLKKAGISC